MTYKKIAKLANVSTSTVSKALSGSSEINKETAERIRQIAIDIGYFKEKNKRKREYANNGSFLIAVIVPEIMGFHYSTIVTFIKNQVEAQGGHLAVYINDFDEQKSTAILQDIILRGSTDGVIMFSKPQLPVKPNIPILLCCGTIENCDYDTISCNTAKLMVDAVQFLSELGHKKIGFVGEPLTATTARHFEAAVKLNRLAYYEEYVYTINARFENIGRVAAQSILAQEERPTAVIAAYDEVAIGLISALSNHGIQVPDDISVMGINNIPSSSHVQPPLTSVQTFSEEYYKLAVDLLFDKIIHETESVRHITIDYAIIQRDTTKSVT